MALETLLHIAEMRDLLQQWRSEGHQIALIPTMGALHDGHLSLVEVAKKENVKIVVSIFVNPLQFGPSEDFSRYPRTLKEDIQKLERAGVHAVFAPPAAQIYPQEFQTHVTNRKMAAGLCGLFRPGHFEGVLTVVIKLFNIVQPDTAYFGKKDYQQWRLIERMVLDLQMPVKIEGCETIRESDGVAMSSRNRYMSDEERKQACLIFEGLTAAKQAWQSGERSTERVIQKFAESISKCQKMAIQYVEIVDKFSLQSSRSDLADSNLVMIVAVLFGDVRLIDNLEF